MAQWPLPAAGAHQAVGALPAASTGTAITLAASVNTKSGWTELIAATTRQGYGITVFLMGSDNTADGLVDIGVGAAGAEQVLAADLAACIVGNGRSSIAYYLPVEIPAGARVAARCALSLISAQVMRVSVLIHDAGMWGAPALRQVITWGAVAADSGGTNVEPGGTAHVKGAWSQLSASTEANIKALVLGIGNQSNAARSANGWLLDVGVGAAGSEQVVIPDVALRSGTINVITPQVVGPLPVSIAAGSRLAVRAQSGSIDATDRLLDVIAYGLT